MRVSISKAAEMVGITRATLYRHIEKKGISVEKDDDDNPKIDVSELIRVYGNKVKVANTETENDTDDTLKTVHVKQSNTPTKSSSINVELEVLRERVKHLEQGTAKTEEERKREREQFEERIEQLQETLNKAQDNQSKTTLLLEHYTKEGRGNEWEQAMKTLEERISNNEETVNLEKEKAQKAEEEKKKLEEALEFEKSKSFIHRLIGK